MRLQPQPPLDTPSIDWGALAPLLVLIGGAVLLMVLAALLRRQPFSGAYAGFTVLTALGSMAATIPLWSEVQDPNRGPFSTVGEAVGIDGFSVFITFLLGASVVLASLFADGYLRREGLQGAELYVLLLLSASGGVIMGSANDLLVTFLGLEILSIAVYVLAAMHLRRIESQEAGMKYFILGAFSSAFFLYGIALIYGAVGSTNLGIIQFVSGGGARVDEVPALFLAGIALLLVGFAFKIAAVPFHAWQPDVYQGSPSPTVVFMASGVKAAGFAGLLRVLVLAFPGYATDWQPYVYVLAVTTLLAGSILAVVQTDVKRMLAYSSISHAGFILLGVQAASGIGVAGALFYLAAYTFMVAGSFGVVTLVSRRGDERTKLDDYRDLARTEPLLALAFTILLLGQAGVPLTSGFFAKFYVLRAAVEAGSWPLALVAMVSAVIAAFLYLRIIVAMYIGGGAEAGEEAEEAEEAEAAAAAVPAGPRISVPRAAGLALGVAVLFTLVIGFFPTPVNKLASDAVPAGPVPGVAQR